MRRPLILTGSQCGRYCYARVTSRLTLLEMQTDGRIEIVRLALQTIDALVRINLPKWVNRLNRAATGADLTFGSAFAIAL